MVNWNPYLESIYNRYAQWWKVYTLTDVESHQRVEVEAPPLLDFMVETVQPAKEEPSQEREKTERLGVLEGLRKYAKEHVLLVGRPGSGKSTALARLLLEEAEKCRGAEEQGSRGAEEKQAKIPMLVELRYYQTSVLDLIRSFFKQHGLLLDKAEIERLLFEQRFLLLVDGLNELPSEAARQDLIVFLRENATTQMIFTTRDLGVGGDLGIIKKLEMQHLTESQMRDFVKRYLLEQGEQMLRQMGSRLREFGQTPLLLWMLCSLFAQTGDVPPNLGLVFRQFTQFCECQRLQDVSVTDESRRWWRRLLEYLALRMTQGSEPTDLQVAIPRQEAEEILTEFLRDKGYHQSWNVLSWLQDLLNHHLIQLGAEDKIEFRHQLIQEYYTAESLLKQLPHLSDDCLKRKYLNYLKWTEPLVLMLELVEDEAQAVWVVKLALEVDFGLGARLAGAVKPKFQAQTVALVAELEILQKVKIELLGITRSINAIALLLQALNNKDSSMRKSAAEALGKIGNQAAVSALVQALNHKDSFVRLRAAEALGKIGNQAAIAALVQALNHQDYSVRWRTAEALGKIGNQAAVSALVQEALNHQDYSVRWRAAEALGKIGNQAAVSALVQALNDEDFYVRLRVAEALGKIGNQAAVSALVQALNDEDFYVRLRAAEALGKIGNQAAVSALVQALNHQDSSVRLRAAVALGNIGNQAAVSTLVQALNHQDSSVRLRAAEALGKIGNQAAVSTLVQALNHKDSFVRWSAAVGLGKIASSELLPHFFDLLQTTGESNLFTMIAAIQERYKYYNYTLISPEPQPTILPATSISIPMMHILHLSDLHFGTLDNAQPWFTQLAADLRRELNCTHLDAVILSGDIANKSTPEEYDAAKLFLDKLSTAFQLKSDQLVIVPGNHDLNWGLAKQAYILMERQDYQGELKEDSYIPVSEDVIRIRDENKYKQRFAHFSKFYQDIKQEPYPLEYEQQGILHHLPEQNLLILGLNSAWQLDHHYKARASIHPTALSNALEKIDTHYTTYEKCVKIAVWHHPLDSAFPDRIVDQGFMEQLAVAGFRLFLHGHIHKAETSLYRYDLSTNGRKLDRICAGTFGAPVQEWVPGYPLQYNLLKLEGDKLTVETRRREELNGAWKPDARWSQGAGKDPLPRYEIQL